MCSSDLANLTTASPRFKIVAGADLTHGPFEATLRGTWFGDTKTKYSPNGGSFYEQIVPSAFIVDLETSLSPTDFVTLSIGANNLFNERPPSIATVPGTTTLVNGGNVFDAPLTFSPYGINGGYYYGRVKLAF